MVAPVPDCGPRREGGRRGLYGEQRDRYAPCLMRRSNLPAELDGSSGVTRNAVSWTSCWRTSASVTVVGVGGAGKTRLVVQAAREAQKRYCDGVHLVELAGLRDPELVDHALAEALGPPTRRAVHRGRCWRTIWRGAGCCWCWTASSTWWTRAPCRGAAAAAERAGTDGARGGRRPLRVDGEAVLALAPMPDGDAVRLFTDRARAVCPGSRPATPTPCGAVPAPGRDPAGAGTGGGPLPAPSVEQVLERLDDRFRLLTRGSRGAAARHRTLRTAIGWSHELCTPEERLLWARLSVFAGPFDLEAVEYVCIGPRAAAGAGARRAGRADRPVGGAA